MWEHTDSTTKREILYLSTTSFATCLCMRIHIYTQTRTIPQDIYIIASKLHYFILGSGIPKFKQWHHEHSVESSLSCLFWR